MLPSVIALYSSSPGHGKSTVAECLHTYGYVTLPFARTLKRMLLPLLTDLGYSPSIALDLLHKKKETILPELGVSSRHLQKTIGTEWGRQCVHPEVWLRVWRIQAEKIQAQGKLVVVDDLRFPNEYDMLRALAGTELWRVNATQRLGPQPPSTHASDSALEARFFDRLIINNGTLAQLFNTVHSFLKPVCTAHLTPRPLPTPTLICPTPGDSVSVIGSMCLSSLQSNSQLSEVTYTEAQRALKDAPT